MQTSSMSAAEAIMANPSSEISNGSDITNSSLLAEASTVKASPLSTESSTFNLLTLHNQNGQYVLQQPLKAVKNGPTIVNTGAAISKGHIIVRQKPMSTYQQSSVSTALLADKATAQRTGIKRPLTTSDNNIITKVIITKNTVPNQAQPFPVRAPVQAYALTSPGGIDLKTSSPQQIQPATLTKTVMLTPQGALSPVKTVITSIPNPDASKLSSSPMKSPAKLTMIPVSGSLNKQSLNTNFTVFSCALNAISQAGSLPTKPGSTSKVIIKQGAAPTGSSSITLKSQTLPTLALQTAQQIMTPQVVHSVRTPQVHHNLQAVTLASPRSLQQIQVPGSRFHYVRLVSPSGNLEATTTTAKQNDITQVVQSSSNVMPLAIAPAPSASQFQITLPFQQQNATLAPKPMTIPVSVSTQDGVRHIILPATSSSSSTQEGVRHIILPATSSSSSTQGSAMTTLVPIQPAPAVSLQNQLPPGASILSSANSNIQGLKSFALVPASYVTQLQQQLNKSQVTQVTAAPPVPRQSRDYVPIASIDPEITQYTVSRNVPNHSGLTLEATGARPRKPCNCTKSQCLKLYCDCFANGEFCQNCNCTSCANNLEHEEERSKAIKCCLDRNPQAFHPKIGKSREVEGNRQHNKGCNCKRSGCLKNYCECYEAKIMCSNFCKCVGCKNFEESPDRKTLMHLADAVEVRVQQQTAAKTKLSSQISCVPSRPPTTTASGERLPFALITTDVAEATSACLLAQAEEAERMKMPPVVQERMIIEEFGRCLLQIIESANRTRTASSLA